MVESKNTVTLSHTKSHAGTQKHTLASILCDTQTHTHVHPHAHMFTCIHTNAHTMWHTHTRLSFIIRLKWSDAKERNPFAVCIRWGETRQQYYYLAVYYGFEKKGFKIHWSSKHNHGYVLLWVQGSYEWWDCLYGLITQYRVAQKLTENFWKLITCE